MTPKATILATAILICGWIVSPNPNARQQTLEFKVANGPGFSFVYRISDFAETGFREEQKKSAEGLGNVVEEGFAPEHFCFDLKDRRPLPALEQGPRYFFPARSFICAIPLEDPSVKDFGEAYPGLNSAAVALKRILRKHPEKLEHRRGVPDVPAKNASPSILSRFQYLDFRSGSGIVFLTQYSNEMKPNPVNNEELTLDFQGITKNGNYYLAARLAITHPSLPRGIDFTGHIERDSRYSYLRRAERELERFSEESFQPSLKSLKALLSSIHVE